MTILDKEKLILGALKRARTPLNRRQIAERSGVELCSVCSIGYSLIHVKRKIKSAGHYRCPITGKIVEFLKVA